MEQQAAVGQDHVARLVIIVGTAVDRIADDRRAEAARFNNGDPVTAEDVRHSHAMLASKGASPSYQTAVAGIQRVVAEDSRTVRFEFKEKSREQVFVAATLPVFSRKWGQTGDVSKTLDAIVTDYPITSGPYVIDKVDMPRRIEFKRNPDYWGKALAVRRGHFNFDRVVYRNYSDNQVALEAFKAGEYDFIKEYSSRSWVRMHKGMKWEDGRILKADMQTGYGNYMQAYNINMRRPIFQDIRVREALAHTYDFETLNKTGIFKRVNSQFNNSEFRVMWNSILNGTVGRNRCLGDAPTSSP